MSGGVDQTTPLTAAEHEERSKALREMFPDMPHGRDVLFGALVDAASAADGEISAEPPSPPKPDHDAPK